MICIECNQREAVAVPVSILPICHECAGELPRRTPPAAPPPPPRPQLGLFDQGEP